MSNEDGNTPRPNMWGQGLPLPAGYADADKASPWDHIDWTALSSDQFESLLLAIRDGANSCVSEHVWRTVKRSPNADKTALEDARAGWHTAEVALGILTDGYMPKFEAMIDVLSLAEKYFGDEYPALIGVLQGVIAEHDEKLAPARATLAAADGTGER